MTSHHGGSYRAIIYRCTRVKIRFTGNLYVCVCLCLSVCVCVRLCVSVSTVYCRPTSHHVAQSAPPAAASDGQISKSWIESHSLISKSLQPAIKVSRPAWSLDHLFGLGLGLGLTYEVLVSSLIRVGLVVTKRLFAFLIN